MARVLFLAFSFLFGFFAVDSGAAPMPAPLSADKAFHLSVKNIQGSTVQLHWEIAPGYHLYRDRFKFQPADPQNAQIIQPVLPAGISQHDAILGDYQIYTQAIDINVVFSQIKKNNGVLLVSYQGCSEYNFCYPPVTKRVAFNINSMMTTHVAVGSPANTLQDKVTRLLQKGNFFWICLGFIGLGLLLAFTPCVLPMIPILSGIIVGQDRQNLNMRRAFFLSLSYVLGMSVAYAIAGVLVALLGSHLSETFQTPWVIVLFSLLFVLLALSLFGLYELRMPHFLHHRVLHLSNKQKPGSYIGALIMGALSVLIVSPCVTAPLVGVLTFIGHSGDIGLGSAALFSLGLGMGLPLLVIGTTEGRYLPKSGYWMHVVKSAFGVLLLAMAIYLLQRVLPGALSLMLWATLFIMLAVYLGVGTQHRHLSSGWIKFSKGLGLLFFCYGIILLAGGAMGNSDFIYPLRIAQNTQASAVVNFKTFNRLVELQTVLQTARHQHKPVMLDFYADWCVACHEMDKTTFSDPAVNIALQSKNLILLRADVTSNDLNARGLQDYFKVIAPPTILFLGPDGKELTQARIVGSMSSQDFLKHLQSEVK